MDLTHPMRSTAADVTTTISMFNDKGHNEPLHEYGSCQLILTLQQTQNLMKSIDWLTIAPLKMSRILSVVALVVFAFACSDGSEDLAGPPDGASARKDNAAVNTPNENGNCESSKDDYIISVVNNDGTPADGSACWKYTITLQPGAKAMSHFIIDLNNCPIPQDTPLSIERFTSAKVNGVDWPLSSSEGEGTGCDVFSDNIVKFDNLPDAQVYEIEFCLNPVYHNALPTTVWIKAGCSCLEWLDAIQGPCCVF